MAQLITTWKRFSIVMYGANWVVREFSMGVVYYGEKNRWSRAGRYYIQVLVLAAKWIVRAINADVAWQV